MLFSVAKITWKMIEIMRSGVWFRTQLSPEAAMASGVPTRFPSRAYFEHKMDKLKVRNGQTLGCFKITGAPSRTGLGLPRS